MAHTRHGRLLDRLTLGGVQNLPYQTSLPPSVLKRPAHHGQAWAVENSNTGPFLTQLEIRDPCGNDLKALGSPRATSCRWPDMNTATGSEDKGHSRISPDMKRDGPISAGLPESGSTSLRQVLEKTVYGRDNATDGIITWRINFSGRQPDNLMAGFIRLLASYLHPTISHILDCTVTVEKIEHDDQYWNSRVVIDLTCRRLDVGAEQPFCIVLELPPNSIDYILLYWTLQRSSTFSVQELKLSRMFPNDSATVKTEITAPLNLRPQFLSLHRKALGDTEGRESAFRKCPQEAVAIVTWESMADRRMRIKACLSWVDAVCYDTARTCRHSSLIEVRNSNVLSWEAVACTSAAPRITEVPCDQSSSPSGTTSGPQNTRSQTPTSIGNNSYDQLVPNRARLERSSRNSSGDEDEDEEDQSRRPSSKSISRGSGDMNDGKTCFVPMLRLESYDFSSWKTCNTANKDGHNSINEGHLKRDHHLIKANSESFVGAKQPKKRWKYTTLCPKEDHHIRGPATCSTCANITELKKAVNDPEHEAPSICSCWEYFKTRRELVEHIDKGCKTNEKFKGKQDMLRRLYVDVLSPPKTPIPALPELEKINEDPDSKLKRIKELEKKIHDMAQENTALKECIRDKDMIIDFQTSQLLGDHYSNLETTQGNTEGVGHALNENQSCAVKNSTYPHSDSGFGA